MREQTLYGSSVITARTASGVLRALASKLGVPLRNADDIDLCASVIAADAWMAITGVTHLESAAGLDDRAVLALSNALARSAGARCAGAEDTATCSLNDNELRLAETYWDWAQAMVGNLAPDAFVRAARDLDVDGPDGRFSRFAELLRVVADSYQPSCPAN